MWNWPSLNSAIRVKKKNELEEGEFLFLPESVPAKPFLPEEPATSVVSEPPVKSFDSPKADHKAEGGEKESSAAETEGAEKKIKLPKHSSTPSIKDALRSFEQNSRPADDQPVQDEGDSLLEEVLNPVEDRPVSEGELSALWSSYIEKLRTHSPRIYLALSSQNPVLLDDRMTVRISFPNNTLQAEFKQSYKASLLAFLREKLNNQAVQFEETISGPESGAKKKYYTDQDKLKHMIEKNPALQKLRHDFNLDFE